MVGVSGILAGIEGGGCAGGTAGEEERGGEGRSGVPSVDCSTFFVTII